MPSLLPEGANPFDYTLDYCEEATMMRADRDAGRPDFAGWSDEQIEAAACEGCPVGGNRIEGGHRNGGECWGFWIKRSDA